MKRKVSEVSDEEELKIWRCNEKVTLVDNDNDGFAHGVVVDGEPDPSIWDNCSKDFSADPSGFWVVMKVTSVSNNAIDLPADSCFAHDGADLNKHQLKPKGLCELQDGILIWHDYLRPRMLALKTPQKSKTKEPVKGSKKKSHR